MHSSASRVAAEARPASDVLADVPAEGPAAIPDDRVHREPEVTAQGIPGPREPSAEEIERRELTHYPAEPWCEICVQAKANDLAHRRVDRKDAIIPLISFDYGQAGEEGDPVNFEFVVGNAASTGSKWSTAIIKKGRADPHRIAAAASRWAELGHSRVELLSGGAAEFSFITAARKKALQDGI